MQKGIIGKKLGMTQLFDENGKVVPVTVIEAGPCTVVQKKTVESDGYQAVQLGFGEVSAKKVNKAAAGHFKKANVAPKKTLREFRLEDVSAMNVGDVLKAGDKVTIAGFGRFEMRERQTKNFTNPKTKVSSRLESTSIPGFKASGRFKQKLEAGKAAKTEEAV